MAEVRTRENLVDVDGALSTGNTRIRRPVRIELVVSTLNVGGMEALTVRMARALVARGHQVGITCTDHLGPLATPLLDAGLKVSFVDVAGALPNVFVHRLRRSFAQSRPDVVHIHNSPWLKAARAAKASGVSNVGVTLHGILEPEPRRHQWLRRCAAFYTDWIVAVSEPLRRYVLRTGLNDRIVHVLVNGIDTKVFRNEPRSNVFRAAIGASDSSIVIGTVARLAKEKNLPMLLRAFATFSKATPLDSHLVVAGNGPARTEILGLIQELSLQGRVHMLGELSRPELLYSDLDIFVLSSDTEGTPMSLLEAMACGRAVISTSVGGVPSIVDDQRHGLLVAKGNVSELAAALMGLAHNDSLRSDLGMRARERVRRCYTQDDMLSAYEALYAGGPNLSSETLLKSSGGLGNVAGSNPCSPATTLPVDQRFLGSRLKL